MDKSAIRNIHLEMRKKISNEKKKEFSEKISDSVLGYLKSNPEVRHIHLFLSIPELNEVNTLPLLEKLQDLGYILYTPYVNPVSKILDTVEITHIKEFEPDGFGIPIPKDLHYVGNDLIQLVLVPLLAFDIKGNRLGYGKGYYDQFLGSMSHKIMKAGLSFFPSVEEIPVEPHDIGLDICITPDKIYYFGHS